MSASALMTLMASRTQESTDQINALNSTLSLTQADLKNAMEMAQGEYQATQADIQAQERIASEERSFARQKEFANYQADLALSQNQAEFAQKIAQQAQLMNDPATAITTMVDEYKKLGVPFSRSTQQMIADFQSSGLDLPAYLSQLQGAIQGKPEYKRIQEIQE